MRDYNLLFIDWRDLEASAVSVRLHHSGPQDAKPKVEMIAEFLAVIRVRCK